MVDLDDEDLKRVAREMGKAAARIREGLLKEAMFGERPSYSPFVSTGTRKPPSHSPLPFRSFIPLWDVITSPYVVEKRRQGREGKRSWWQRLWDGLTDLNPWPYSPIEYYEVEIPAIMSDRVNNRIICHPAIEQQVKKAVREGVIR